MIVNGNTITGLFRSLHTAFVNAFDAAETQWEKIATKVPSTTKTNDYGWLSMFPRLQKWIGDKTAKKLVASGYSITNDDWEAGVTVKRSDIEDDNLFGYAALATDSGESSRQFPDDIVFELVNNAFTAPCFDGQYFCDTDHPVTLADGTTVSVSNRIDKALSIASLAKAMGSFGLAKTMMRKMITDGGIKVGTKPNILLVGPALEDLANTLMTTDRLQDGQPNLYKGSCEVVVSEKINSDTAWFLLHTKRSLKPFIYQERKKPEPVYMTDTQSEAVWRRAEFEFGVEARGAGGYGLWQYIVGSTGTDNN